MTGIHTEKRQRKKMMTTNAFSCHRTKITKSYRIKKIII